MRKRRERPLIVLFNILLSMLDDLWSLRDDNTIFRVQSSNPGSVVVVPSIVVFDDHLFDLLLSVLIDLLLGWC